MAKSQSFYFYFKIFYISPRKIPFSDKIIITFLSILIWGEQIQPFFTYASPLNPGFLIVFCLILIHALLSFLQKFLQMRVRPCPARSLPLRYLRPSQLPGTLTASYVPPTCPDRSARTIQAAHLPRYGIRRNQPNTCARHAPALRIRSSPALCPSVSFTPFKPVTSQ